MDLQLVVREALATVLGERARSLPGEADLLSHGLTSVQAIEVVFGLEDRLGIEVPDEHISRSTFQSIDLLVRTLRVAMDG